MDLATKQIYLSQQVLFHENQSPLETFSAAHLGNSSPTLASAVTQPHLPQPPPVRMDRPPTSASPPVFLKLKSKFFTVHRLFPFY
ncbi:hypothetical protein F0562_030417 [Nyssa sinensis]|uniref:Uncharacterized protein n=1 Tax=Nyssa sinensis TaxID=561372 RepID=A0A5J5AYA1_9ASTE|nr:hypothetical protein F0562_030417 [Nyssa sinensis]